jgi:hypothetical protein
VQRFRRSRRAWSPDDALENIVRATCMGAGAPKARNEIIPAKKFEAALRGGPEQSGGAGNRKRAGTGGWYDCAARRHDATRGGATSGADSCI